VAEAAAGYLPLSTGGIDWAVRQAVLHELPPAFRMRELQARFPDVPAGRLRRVLQSLRAAGALRTEGRGPGTRWIRTEPGTAG